MWNGDKYLGPHKDLSQGPTSRKRINEKKKIIVRTTQVKLFSLTVLLLGIEKKTTAPNGTSGAQDTKPRFNDWPNCSFNLSQKCNLNRPGWNFLVKNHYIIIMDPLHPLEEEEAICMIKHCHYLFLQKRCPGLKTTFFLSLALWGHPSSFKIFHFYNFLGLPFQLFTGMLLDSGIVKEVN